MNPIFAYLLLFVPVLAFSQPDSISFPMKGRIVFYESVVAHNGKAKDITNVSAKWITDTFKDIKEPKPATKVTGSEIEGAGIIKVVINDAGDFYWLRLSITMRVTDSTTLFQAYNFYEKPTFPGVTNDWSKIEYRWRDFKKGKPWSPGDARLFAGLDAGVKELIRSFELRVTSKR